jgi:hypothetical protein
MGEYDAPGLDVAATQSGRPQTASRTASAAAAVAAAAAAGHLAGSGAAAGIDSGSATVAAAAAAAAATAAVSPRGGGGGGAARLRVFSVLPTCLAERAKEWGSHLDLTEGWRKTDRGERACPEPGLEKIAPRAGALLTAEGLVLSPHPPLPATRPGRTPRVPTAAPPRRRAPAPPGFFDAPGALAAASLVPAAAALAGAAMPRVTAVFAAVEESRLLGRGRRGGGSPGTASPSAAAGRDAGPAAEAARLLRVVVRAALNAVPGGYLCSEQVGARGAESGRQQTIALPWTHKAIFLGLRCVA